MAVIQNVEIYWAKLNPERPDRYQGKGPAKNSIQIRVYDKKVKDQLTKDYGFKFTTDEAEDGKVFYRTSLSRYTYRVGPDGQEDVNNPNKPVNVILMDGTPIDPDTIGNGSIGNVSFSVKDDKSSRTLKGIQLRKYVKFEKRGDLDEFELSDDFEIVEPGTQESKKDDVY